MIEELKQRAKEEIARILRQMSHRGMENCQGILEQCLRNGGGHLNDKVLKNKMACTEFFSDKNIYVVR
jgi:predicted GNAT family N-acyltransferase